MVIFRSLLGFSLAGCREPPFLVVRWSHGIYPGFYLAGLVFKDSPEWVIIVSGLAIGLIGAALARFLPAVDGGAGRFCGPADILFRP